MPAAAARLPLPAAATAMLPIARRYCSHALMPRRYFRAAPAGLIAASYAAAFRRCRRDAFRRRQIFFFAASRHAAAAAAAFAVDDCFAARPLMFTQLISFFAVLFSAALLMPQMPDFFAA